MESLNPTGAPRVPSLLWRPRRRDVLKLGAAGGASWLSGLAGALARSAETRQQEPAQSIIVLWMAGGPSQLETFDPHPGTEFSGDTQAIATASRQIRLAAGLEHLAEQMDDVSVVRSLVSKEGDHERATYLVKTGYRPDPTAVHPSIGAVCCHELPEGDTDIPRHISILPGQWPARGGFLGDQYDAFKVFDPRQKLRDVTSQVSDGRTTDRLAALEMLERGFARGRRRQAEATMHRHTTDSAKAMMTSDQLKAFDLAEESAELRAAYGDTPFGRGCLAARRLIEVGVRAVEVTLDGWDSHAKNHEIHDERKKVLDPAFATLVRDLRQRNLLDRTIVLCAGEFGRTPEINRLGGRDHWIHGFSVALAGGGLRGGLAVGATDPQGSKNVEQPRQISDVHATIFKALSLDPAHELITPVGRPLKLSEGTPIGELLSAS